MFQEKDFSKRLIGIQWMVALSFLALGFRLWQLQIIKGSEYLAKSKKNRIRVQRIQAPRGHILDARGRRMVKNSPSFTVDLIPQYLQKQVSAQENLARIFAL